MRAVPAFLLVIATVSELYSFQRPDGAASGRGIVQGHVVESKSGDAVKKAIVILRRGQDPGTGALTDETGAFRFDDIETGAYTVSAERDGFVLAPESERTVVEVKPGPAESELTLKLIRTGAISGRVLDIDGDPVTGASVQVVAIPERKQRPSRFNAVTNDRGEYRSFNIPPGRYRLAVSYEPRLRQIQVRMQRPRAQSSSTPDETYALTYYPATLDPKQARTIDVEAGMDLQGFDIQILRARGVTVRGTVSAGGGASPGAIVLVTLSPIGQTVGFRSYENVVRDSSDAFEIAQVLPGVYALSAEAPLNGRNLSTTRAIEVGSADVEGISLTLAPPQTISGTIIVPEGRTIPGSLIAFLAPRESRDNRAGGMSQPGKDGVFQMRDVPAGDYDLIIGNTGAGDDLYVSAIEVGDDDALASGIHIGEKAVGPLRIVMKGNGGVVQVNARDVKDKPLPDAFVRLVPDSPRRAQMALYSECKTDARGTCVLLGVAPGSYHAFAFGEEKRIDFRDPAATSEIEDSGKAISVSEGEHKSIELMPVPES
jgi:hypothetical protein